MSIKNVTEYIRGLRYKLWIMQILVVNCALIFGDNQSVLKKTTSIDSKLK